MKTLTIPLWIFLMLISCKKNEWTTLAESSKKKPSKTARFQLPEEPRDERIPRPRQTSGDGQGSGYGSYTLHGECGSSSEGVAYSVRMTGMMHGCLDVYIDHSEFSPAGIYESGREHFIGDFAGEAGSFWAVYAFQSKNFSCAPKQNLRRF